jgi:hypothetical protein
MAAWEIDGLRIAGLGGIFRGQVWAPPGEWLHERPEDFAARCGKGNLWRGGLPRKHRSSIFPADYFGLVGQRADILVTHEAPSSHPHGFDAIDELGRSLGVSKAFTAITMIGWTTAATASGLGSMPSGSGSAESATPTAARCGQAT